MTLAHRLAGAMRMNDEVWARHASPWSVWTRVPVLPALLLAIFSAHWVGWWSLALVVPILIWIWWNPRAFAPPQTTDNWASKATFGERVWLNRSEIPIPAHHARWANILGVLSGIGLIPALYGLMTANAWATAFGGAVSFFGKLWFCDRMVWLYEDMKNADPRYAGWLKTSAQTG